MHELRGQSTKMKHIIMIRLNTSNLEYIYCMCMVPIKATVLVTIASRGYTTANARSIERMAHDTKQFKDDYASPIAIPPTI